MKLNIGSIFSVLTVIAVVLVGLYTTGRAVAGPDARGLDAVDGGTPKRAAVSSTRVGGAAVDR